MDPLRVSEWLLLCMSDPGVQFVSGLTDVTALMGQPAEILCKVNSEICEGAWFRDGKKVSPQGIQYVYTVSLHVHAHNCF